MMQCILPQSQTTPEKTLSNPWLGKGFCEPHQYKAAIERCEGGYQSCELSVEMYRDLVKILENTAASLRQWSTASQKKISQSKECNTTKRTWGGSIRAVEKLAERHDSISEGIKRTVIDKTVSYKNENYGKSFGHSRKTKEFEKEFKKAQKSWLELLGRINDAKAAFHTTKRKLNDAIKTAKITESDVGSSDDEKQKHKTNVEVRQKEMERYRTKYQNVLQEMERAKPDYEKRMYKILEDTDEFERKRMQHFNAVFNALQQAMSLDKDKCHAEMAAAFKKAIDEHDISGDINFFNTNYGKETKNHWPEFEDLKD